MIAKNETVTPKNRFSNENNRCPICDGHSRMKQGQGVRCTGFKSEDGNYAVCTREQYAGDLNEIDTGTGPGYRHLLHGKCNCGKEHGVAFTPYTPKRSNQTNGKDEIVATYSYQLPDGRLAYQAVRYEPKTFKQRQPDSQAGAWNWSMKGAIYVPYNLSAIIKSSPDTIIYTPEGEKDANNLIERGLLATTFIGGAMADQKGKPIPSKWKSEYGQYFKGRHMVILPDNDAPGRGHAEVVLNALKDIAASIRIVTLPDLPEKGDVSDWLEAGGTVEQLDKLRCETDAYDKRTNEKKTAGPDESQSESRADKSSDEATFGSSDKPTFVIEGQLRDQRDKALEILRMANQQKTECFIYLSMISEVAFDEMNNPIIMQVDRAALRNTLNAVADFAVWKKKPGEKSKLVDAHPPKDLADQILALPPNKWPFPALKAIVEAPVLRPDGSILDKPGYDAKTRLYYVPSPGMEKCKIPMNPTKDDAIKSMDFIKKMFVDFPFEGKPDVANTIALLFTPFVRYAVTKDIQMALIDATNAGTGKGLISIIVSIAATGKTTTPMTAKRDDDEWRKAILTELLQAPRIVIIDNIRGTLESAALELMLTGNGINERILGQSKSAKPKNEATWMATGNNLLIGGDLPRRCYRIRLISPTANPEERDDFEIKDLEQWVEDHRKEVVTAILTVARAWYAAGKPQPKNVPNLGTFTNWAKTVGGMLEFAGVENFQGNRDDLRSKNNEEAKEWEAFLSAWLDFYGDEWKSATDIAEDLKKVSDPNWQPPAKANEPTAKALFDVLPQYLKTALAEKPKSFAVVLPIQLGKRVQTVFGNEAYHIERGEDSHTKTKAWKVLRGVAGGSNRQAGKNKNLNSSETIDSIVNDTADGATNPPQPPANDNLSTNKNATSHRSTGYSMHPSGENLETELAGGLNQKPHNDTDGNQSYSAPVGESDNDDEGYEEII